MRPTNLLPNFLRDQPPMLAGLMALWFLTIAGVTATAPEFGLAAILTPLLIIWFLADRSSALYLLVFLLPFSNSIVLGQNILGIQGFKPTNVLAVFVALSLFFDTTAFVSVDKYERRATIIFASYVLLFLITAMRSIKNAALFNSLNPLGFPDSSTSYIFSYIVRPLTLLIPFFVILKRMRSYKQLDTVIRIIAASMFVLSSAAVVLLALNPSVLADPSRAAVADLFQSNLGLHYNDLGTIFGMVFPLMLHKALRGGMLWWANLSVLVVAILLIESRTTLLQVAITTVVYLLATRRTNALLLGVILSVAVLPVAVLPSINALFSVGLNSGQDLTADSIFTGRIAHIWQPLLSSWMASPTLLLFGAGRYGIMTSHLWMIGVVFNAVHAHNAFLDFFIDTGLPMLVVAVISIVMFLRWTWALGRKYDDDFYWALLLCVVGYLIQTITGTGLYPNLDNMELFPLLAILLNLIRLKETGPRRAAPLDKRGRPVPTELGRTT